MLAEVVVIELAPEETQFIQMAQPLLKNTVSMVFDAAMVGRTLVGTP
jgi:hypothetical protein